MSRMASIPRSTRVLEISMTNSSSSADRSHLSKDCRSHTYTSASFASHTPRSVSYGERRILHSSNVRLKLIECLEPNVKVCVLAR
jgi:hypothetical protein